MKVRLTLISYLTIEVLRRNNIEPFLDPKDFFSSANNRFILVQMIQFCRLIRTTINEKKKEMFQSQLTPSKKTTRNLSSSPLPSQTLRDSPTRGDSDKDQEDPNSDSIHWEIPSFKRRGRYRQLRFFEDDFSDRVNEALYMSLFREREEELRLADRENNLTPKRLFHLNEFPQQSEGHLPTMESSKVPRDTSLDRYLQGDDGSSRNSPLRGTKGRHSRTPSSELSTRGSPMNQTSFREWSQEREKSLLLERVGRHARCYSVSPNAPKISKGYQK